MTTFRMLPTQGETSTAPLPLTMAPADVPYSAASSSSSFFAGPHTQSLSRPGSADVAGGGGGRTRGGNHLDPNALLREHVVSDNHCHGWCYVAIDARMPAEQKRALIELALRERLPMLEDGGAAAVGDVLVKAAKLYPKACVRRVVGAVQLSNPELDP